MRKVVETMGGTFPPQADLSAKGGEVVFQYYVWQPLTVPIESGRKWMAVK